MDERLRAVGYVESPLTDPTDAPRQADEGAPAATLAFLEPFRDALRGVEPGATAILLTWLHRARRDVLVVHPRGDRERPPQGVFSTRSQDRPNPIGIHEIEITAVDDLRLSVRSLEAIDRTPILDLKPSLGPLKDR